jgi:hypothetical protein
MVMTEQFNWAQTGQDHWCEWNGYYLSIKNAGSGRFKNYIDGVRQPGRAWGIKEAKQRSETWAKNAYKEAQRLKQEAEDYALREKIAEAEQANIKFGGMTLDEIEAGIALIDGESYGPNEELQGAVRALIEHVRETL